MTYKEKMKDERNVYIISILLFGVAYFALGYSFFLDLSNEHENELTQRAGSVLVLMGIIIEFLLLQVSRIELHEWIDSPMNEKQRTMPLIFVVVQSIAHITIVLGTVMWGYFDLLWHI